MKRWYWIGGIIGTAILIAALLIVMLPAHVTINISNNLVSISLGRNVAKAATTEYQTRVPTSDGDITGTWNTAPRWDDVDETTYNDADYITGTAVGRCLFNFTAFDVPRDAWDITLKIYYRVRDVTSGTNNIRAAIKVNGVYYDTTSTSTDPTTTFTTYSFVYAINPATGSWLPSEINGGGTFPLQQFGVYSTDVTPNIRVSMVYAEATYTTAGMGIESVGDTKQIIISGTSDDPTNSGTEYNGIMGDGNFAWDTTENNRKQLIATGGIITNFQVKVKTAPGAGNSWDFTIRIGTPIGDTALSVSIAEGNTLSALDTDQVVVAAGDESSIKAVGTSSPTAAAAVYWTFEFIPTTDGETVIMGGAASVSNSSYYYCPLSSTNFSGIEFDCQLLFPTPGTLKLFYIELSVAPGGVTSRTFTFRQNEGAVTIAKTITGAETTTNDLVNTFDIAAGDRVSIYQTVSGAPAATKGWWGCVFLPDTQGEFITCATTIDPTSSTAVEYGQLTHDGSTLTNTENEQHNLARACTAKKIYVRLATSPGANNWIFTLRKGTYGAMADTSLTVTLNNATTGNAAVDVAVSDANLLDTLIDATAGAATSKTQIAYLFYNAPEAGGGTPAYNQ